MVDHTVSSYQNELNDLDTSLVQMSKYFLDLLELQNKAMQNFGEDYIKDSIDLDLKINQCDEHIEVLATTVLATRQPLAIDLRFVVSAIRIAVILERMGDLSKNVIKRSSYIQTDMLAVFSEDILKMNRSLIEMMKRICTCFQKWETSNAMHVIKLDDNIDTLYSNFMNKISDLKIEKKNTMSDSIQIVMASKNIERIGEIGRAHV